MSTTDDDREDMESMIGGLREINESTGLDPDEVRGLLNLCEQQAARIEDLERQLAEAWREALEKVIDLIGEYVSHDLESGNVILDRDQLDDRLYSMMDDPAQSGRHPIWGKVDRVASTLPLYIKEYVDQVLDERFGKGQKTDE